MKLTFINKITKNITKQTNKITKKITKLKLSETIADIYIFPYQEINCGDKKINRFDTLWCY